MLSKWQLEQTNIIELAILCGRVADDPSMDEATAEKARQLKHDWAVLVVRESPPPSVLKENEEIQKQKAVLKDRMVELLVTI